MLAVLAVVSRFKYLITIVLGVIWVGFVDETSIVQRVKYEMRISELKSEIQHYDGQTKAANAQLQAIATNPKAIEKIARERYFMKAADEDIFVLSSDDALPAEGQGNTNQTDETVE